MTRRIFEELWPLPAELHERPGRIRLEELERLERAAPEPYDPELGDQAYRLELSPEGKSSLRAGAAAGDFYGRQTIRQLLVHAQRRGVAHVPACWINDAPARARRGVMFDVSRNKVPTLDTLKAQIDRLARCKLNEVQLYFEHTFAYTGAEEVWKNASPFTGTEIRELDTFCRERHIDLVPNQQSFGHMHRWLKHDGFRHLSELPEGIEHAFSLDREPYGLCATDPSSLEFLAGLYDELLPNFSSEFFNVGLDETIDLGLGRSRERCDAVGKARVHLQFMLAVESLVRSRGRRMMYWADEQEKSRELRDSLPRSAVACVWGYEAGDPLLEKSAVFAEEGLDLVICPGTSSWQSFGGRTTNLMINLREATEAGQRRDALGMLICDWGDRGHFQPYAIAETGWLLGIGLAWNPRATGVLDDAERAAAVVSEHAFADATGTVGRWLQRLGQIDALAGGRTTNGAALFFTVFFATEPFPHERTVGLNEAGIRRARAELQALRHELPGLPLGREDGELVRTELEQVLSLLGFACRLALARLGVPEGSQLNAVNGQERRALHRELSELLEESFGELWLARNRPGGLPDSVKILERTLEALRT